MAQASSNKQKTAKIDYGNNSENQKNHQIKYDRKHGFRSRQNVFVCSFVNNLLT